MQWQAIASKAIGTKHLQQGMPCQDYLDYRISSQSNVAFGAVSDGLGSARRSELGSRLAVEVVISELSKEDWRPLLVDECSAKEFFSNLLDLVKAAIRRQAYAEGYMVQDLACTLLVIIATPKYFTAMQVGDGFVVVRSEEDDYQLLFEPRNNEFANETSTVTSVDALRDMNICFKQVPYRFICVATDGIEHISLIKREAWKPFINFFKPLEKLMLSDIHKERKQEQLDIFLRSPKIYRNTGDDVSILLFINLISISDDSIDDQERLEPDSMLTRDTKIRDTKILKKPNPIDTLKLFNVKPYTFYDAGLHIPDNVQRKIIDNPINLSHFLKKVRNTGARRKSDIFFPLPFMRRKQDYKKNIEVEVNKVVNDFYVDHVPVLIYLKFTSENLEIYIDSDNPLNKKAAIVSEINAIVSKFGSKHISRITIINYRERYSIEHWSQSLSLHKRPSKRRMEDNGFLSSLFCLILLCVFCVCMMYFVFFLFDL